MDFICKLLNLSEHNTKNKKYVLINLLPLEVIELIRQFWKINFLYPSLFPGMCSLGNETIKRELNYCQYERELDLGYPFSPLYYSSKKSSLIIPGNYLMNEIQLSKELIHEIINKKNIHHISWSQYISPKKSGVYFKRIGRYFVIIYYDPWYDDIEHPKDYIYQNKVFRLVGAHRSYVPIYMIICLLNGIDINMDKYVLNKYICQKMKTNVEYTWGENMLNDFCLLEDDEEKQYSSSRLSYRIL